MLQLLWRMTRGYRLRPWRSPYLRWRIETYSGLHAETITFRQFWEFTWKSRRALIRYLRWAARAAQPAPSRPSQFAGGRSDLPAMRNGVGPLEVSSRGPNGS